MSRPQGPTKPEPPAGVDLGVLARASVTLARAASESDLIQRCLLTLTDDLHAAAATLWLYDKTRGGLDLAGERGSKPAPESGGRPEWADQFRIPLNSGGRLIGVLEVYTDAPGGFDDDVRGATQVIGALLADGVQRCRLNRSADVAEADALRERVASLEFLCRLWSATSHAQDYRQLFEALLTCLAGSVPYDAAALLLLHEDGAECVVSLQRRGHTGQIERLTRWAADAVGKDRAGERLLDNLAVRLLHVPEQPPAVPLPLSTGFALPLEQGGRLAGLIYVAAVAEDAFSEAQIRTLHTFAEQAAESMERVGELAAAEAERLKTIIDSLPQGVVLLDAGGRLLLANRPGRGSLPLLAGDTEPVTRIGDSSIEALVEEAIGTGIDLVQKELEVRQGDRTFHFAVTLVPVREDEEMVGVVLSIIDISDVRQTEHRLFQDARLASIGELASGLAHELNNPMMIMLGTAEMLTEDHDLPHPVRAHLATIQDAAMRAVGIVRKLTQFADAQRGEGWDTLSMDEVVGQALELFESQLDSDRVTLRRCLATPLPPVQGNAGTLQQLLIDLLRNAQEAIQQGGRGDSITLSTGYDDTCVYVEVADNGPGVPEELRERIFDVFFTTKRDHQGKGLGLSIAHRIAREHGGSLRLCSADGAGAKFQLQLPRHHWSDEGVC